MAEATAARPGAPGQDATDAGQVVDRDVVVVGGGFGGLACARGLGGSAASVTLIDRTNHNLFQPLLYQVATAALSPADIAEPIRRILRRHRNVEVVLGEVTGIDTARRIVTTTEAGSWRYRKLVLAPGSTYNYFGHEDWAETAPGLKTIDQARRIRARLLESFERAETSRDPALRDAALRIVVIGGGPTGVEMAGAVAELAHWSLARDFRHIDPGRAEVVLLEAGPRILAAFPEDLSRYAADRLARLGVSVRTGQTVEAVSAEGVTVGGRLLPARTVIWGAGIRASRLGMMLGVEPDRIGRVAVGPDLAVLGIQDVHVVGDLARREEEPGRPLPGLAQVAKQQGEHLGRHLAAALASGRPVPPFRFRDRGNTAVIGRHAAVFDFGRWRLKGRIAWLLWAFVHVYLLVSFEKRLLVSIQWLWRYLTRERGARIID